MPDDEDDIVAWRIDTVTVYALVDMGTGYAFYIGIARSPFRRWQGHLDGIDRETPKARMLSYVNCGNDGAGMAILATCANMSDARKLERYLITKHAATLTNTQHGATVHTRDTDGARFMHAPPLLYGEPDVPLDAALGEHAPCWKRLRDDIAWAHDCEVWRYWKRDALHLSAAEVITSKGQLVSVTWRQAPEEGRTYIEVSAGRWVKGMSYEWAPYEPA